MDATKRLYNVSKAHTIDAYSDGTPVTGTDGIEKHSAAAWVNLMLQSGTRPSVPANPSAGSIHAREAAAPWRRAGEATVTADLAAAKPALQAKHYTGLAQQTANGLLRQHGVKIDASALAVDLQEAAKVRSKIARLEQAYMEQKEEAMKRFRDAAAEAQEQAAERAMAAELLRLRTVQAEEEAAAAAGGRKGGKGGSKGSKGASKSSAKKAAADGSAAEERARIAAMDDGEMQVAADAVGAAAGAAAAEALMDSLQLPARPEHGADTLKAVALLEAVARHDLLAVLAHMGLRSRRRQDRTMTHLSAASKALPSR